MVCFGLAAGCPVVNIGPRQSGRRCAENVLPVGFESEAIESALRRCFDAEFIGECKSCHNPYALQGGSAQVAEIMVTITLDSKLLRKRNTI